MSGNTNVEMIGKIIRQRRKERGMTQKELAHGVCSESLLSQLENGSINLPSSEILKGLCERLGLKVNDLITGIDQSSIEVDVLIDIIKVQIHQREYDAALTMIQDLFERGDILKYKENQLLICKADCLTRTGKESDAIDLLSSLQNELETNQETDVFLLADISNKLGNAFYFQSNMISAYTHYMRAYQLSMRFSHENILSATISYNLGMVCLALRFDREAHIYIERAKAYFDKINDNRSLAYAFYYLGIVAKNLNDMHQAGEYLRTAQLLYETENIFHFAQLAKAQHAFYILAPQDPHNAIVQLLSAATSFEQNDDPLRVAYSYARAALIYLGISEHTEAEKLIKKALECITNDKSEDYPEYAFVYRVYGNYLLIVNEFDESLQYSFKSAEIFGKMGLEKERATSLRQAITIYQSLGEVDEALKLSLQVNEILDNALESLSLA